MERLKAAHLLSLHIAHSWISSLPLTDAKKHQKFKKIKQSPCPTLIRLLNHTPHSCRVYPRSLYLPYSFCGCREVTGGEELTLIEESAGGSLSPLMFAVHRGGLAADFLPAGFFLKLQHWSCSYLIQNGASVSSKEPINVICMHALTSAHIASAECFLSRSDKKTLQAPPPPPHHQKKSLTLFDLAWLLWAVLFGFQLRGHRLPPPRHGSLTVN